MITIFGEQIDDLTLMTEFSKGKLSRSKSYIYYDTKELLYENTLFTPESIACRSNIIILSFDKAIRRLINETKYNNINDDIQKRIFHYILNTFKNELNEIKPKMVKP